MRVRAGYAVLAILCALVIGHLTVPELPPRIERVTETKIVTIPGLTLPPAPRRRATLEDVRRDWKIEGRLSCTVHSR
jgi:hypothetical protein